MRKRLMRKEEADKRKVVVDLRDSFRLQNRLKKQRQKKKKLMKKPKRDKHQKKTKNRVYDEQKNQDP